MSEDTATKEAATAKAFEEPAVEREAGLNRLVEKETGSKLVFVHEDRDRQVKSAGLDHSNIPATPDSLVSDGFGLQVFLRHTSTMDARRPTLAVGEQNTPAIMSYGGALAMSGTPGISSDNTSKQSQEVVERSAEEQMGQCTLFGPKTEKEHRLLDKLNPPTKALLTEDEQWALFASDKFLPYKSMLAREYCRLVAEKVKAEKDSKESKESGKEAAAESVIPKSSVESTTDNNGWPQVEGLDWAGFTNWVAACERVDKQFLSKTLPLWHEQREERKRTIVDALEKWTPPANFDDGSSQYPDPRKYWPHEMTLAEIDMKELGLNPQTFCKYLDTGVT